MIPFLAFWAFFNFIYLKIAMEFAFSSGITIFSDFLISIILSVAIFVASGIYAVNLFFINGVDNPPKVSLLVIIKKTALTFLMVSFIYCLTTRGIVFGFSENLSDKLSSRYESFENFIIFYASVIFPFLLHYFVTLYPAYYKANSNFIEDNSAEAIRSSHNAPSGNVKFYNMNGIPATYELNHLGLPVCKAWYTSSATEIEYTKIRDVGREISREEFDKMILAQERLANEKNTDAHNSNITLEELKKKIEVAKNNQ